MLKIPKYQETVILASNLQNTIRRGVIKPQSKFCRNGEFRLRTIYPDYPLIRLTVGKEYFPDLDEFYHHWIMEDALTLIPIKPDDYWYQACFESMLLDLGILSEGTYIVDFD